MKYHACPNCCSNKDKIENDEHFWECCNCRDLFDAVFFECICPFCKVATDLLRCPKCGDIVNWEFWKTPRSGRQVNVNKQSWVAYLNCAMTNSAIKSTIISSAHKLLNYNNIYVKDADVQYLKWQKLNDAGMVNGAMDILKDLKSGFGFSLAKCLKRTDEKILEPLFTLLECKILDQSLYNEILVIQFQHTSLLSKGNLFLSK